MESPKVTRAELESARTKIYYGLGSIAFGVKNNGFQTILLPFYNLVLHLPAQLVGFAIAIAFAVDALLDPIVGQVSDNLRTPWGRRHPLMYLSAPLVAISYLLLWNPPHWSATALFWYLIVCAIVSRTFITFYEIPSSALVPELTTDYDQRTSFINFRIFFGWAGGMAMQLLALFVFLRPDAHHTVGQLNASGYRIYGFVAAGLMFCAIIVSALGTHAFIPLFRVPEKRKVTIGRYLREMLATLNNRAFFILMSAAFFLNLATGLVFALNFYVATFFWRLNNNQLGILAIGTALAVVFSFLLAPSIAKRFGKKKGAIGMFAVGYILGHVPLVLGLLGIFLRPGMPMLLPALFGFTVVAGAFSIGSSVLIGAMIADIVEDSELKTGRRSEGLLFAGHSLLQKAVSGLGVFASGMVLWATHFPSKALPQDADPQVIHHFAISYIVIVAVLYAVGFAIISFFPIERQDHLENLARLGIDAAEGGAPAGLDIESSELVVEARRELA